MRCLLKQDFAVILLDVNMPGMDGFETAALIRQRQRSETTPIIFISAVNDTETHVSRGYSLGAVDYILTPVVPEILRAKIAVFVDLYKKTEQVKRQAEERAKYLREQAALAEAEARQERLAFWPKPATCSRARSKCDKTFQNLADLVVPRLADFCVVFASDDGSALRQVAMAHLRYANNPALQRAGRRVSDKCRGPKSGRGSCWKRESRRSAAIWRVASCNQFSRARKIAISFARSRRTLFGDPDPRRMIACSERF